LAQKHGLPAIKIIRPFKIGSELKSHNLLNLKTGSTRLEDDSLGAAKPHSAKGRGLLRDRQVNLSHYCSKKTEKS
jgi:hypothetical protein